MTNGQCFLLYLRSHGSLSAFSCLGSHGSSWLTSPQAAPLWASGSTSRTAVSGWVLEERLADSSSRRWAAPRIKTVSEEVDPRIKTVSEEVDSRIKTVLEEVG